MKFNLKPLLGIFLAPLVGVLHPLSASAQPAEGGDAQETALVSPEAPRVDATRDGVALEVMVNQVDTSAYPKVSIFATVLKGGVPVLGLTMTLPSGPCKDAGLNLGQLEEWVRSYVV